MPTPETLFDLLHKQKRPAEDIELIKKAYAFAARVHAGQTRKSGEPYITHPLTTAVRIAEARLDTPTIAASLLHDTCEETQYTIEDIRKNFGDEIAFLVDGVTKIDHIRYRGQERSAESLRKMFIAIAEDLRIVILKLTDRLHNMETLSALPPEKQKRIALETLDIYAPLAYRLGIRELSGRLEDLSFPYVYPEEHRWLVRSTRDKYALWTAEVTAMEPALARELTAEHVPFTELSARVKRYYSLYKKLQKYDMDITKITDVVALRVIVPTIEACYATLGVVHKLWRPLPGKIKDYIALPKPNGYRSLHTTIIGPGGHPGEIQIRTPEMHEEAEHGIAAHWAYHEFKKSDPQSYAERRASFANQKKFAWIRQLREWEKEFQQSDEFLESLKVDFFKNRIFVLTPKGDPFDLPEGATPIDFAYHIHSDLGNRSVGAKINGKMAALDSELRSGDIVEILTRRTQKPSRDWLEFVKSAHARKKIMAYLRKLTESKAFTAPSGELVEFRITGRDRIGFLEDISRVFTRQKISIRDIASETKNRTYPVTIIQASFRNRRELEKLVTKLKQVKSVEEVSQKFL